MSRHDHLKAQWQLGQIWETRVEGCEQWVLVGGLGRTEPVWDERQDYRRVENVPMVTHNFPVLEFGHGRIEVGDAVFNELPALWFGNNGQGLGVERDRNNFAADGETLAILTFTNLQSLEAVEKAVARVRVMMEAQVAK